MTAIFWPVVALFLVAALGYATGYALTSRPSRKVATAFNVAVPAVTATILAVSLVAHEVAREPLLAVGFALLACYAHAAGAGRGAREGSASRGAALVATLEAVALDIFFRRVERLPDEKKAIAFGTYENDPPHVRVSQGVLSFEQARVLYDVAYHGKSADNLDRLLPGGDLEVTDDQWARLTEILGDDARPLLSTLARRLDERSEKR